MELALAAGKVGPKPDQVLPGAMIGVSRIGIIRVNECGPHTVDAAVVNPEKPIRRRKSK